jgi:non-heme chloroperoxidase
MEPRGRRRHDAHRPTQDQAFAQFAFDQNQFALATWLWADALASDPRLGDNRQAQHRCKAVLIAAVPPLLLKTPANPGGAPIEVFDQLRAQVIADRSRFWKELSLPFYGYNRPGAKISEGVCESFWLQGMLAGFPAAYQCIKAFSETDQTEDLRRIGVPTLIIQGDDDQIVPFAGSGVLQSKLVTGATLKVYKGAPHGLCTTHKHQVNEDLLAFLRS